MTVNPGWQTTASGLYIPLTREKPSRKQRYGTAPLAIDLFAGCGGFSLGFIQAGWRVVSAVEWDETAAITYMVNLATYPVEIHYSDPSHKVRLEKAMNSEMKRCRKNKIEMPLAGSGWLASNRDRQGCPHFWFGDIRHISGQDILDALGLKKGEIDCVMGGPPCQGFSTSGKRDVMDPRNSLIFDFARLVLEIQPQTMMMENVPGIVNMVTPEGVPVIDALCRILEDGDFGTYETLKRSITASAGLGAAMKGRAVKKPAARTKSNNPTLFDLEGVPA